MRKVISKKARIFLAWMLVVVMQLTSSLPVATAFASGSGGGKGPDSTTGPAIELPEEKGPDGGISLLGEDFDGIIEELSEDTKNVKDFVVETTEDIDDNYRPQIGDKLELRLDFVLEQGHGYGDGTQFTYKLPEPLKAVSGSGDLIDGKAPGKTYGKYEVTDGTVTITFNERIRDEIDTGTMGAETNVWFKIEAEFIAGNNSSQLEWKIELPGGQEIEVDLIPSGGNTIIKEAVAENSGKNSQYVEWTVDVNTEMDDLGGGMIFTDTLIGNHKYEEGSLVVRKYELDARCKD